MRLTSQQKFDLRCQLCRYIGASDNALRQHKKSHRDPELIRQYCNGVHKGQTNLSQHQLLTTCRCSFAKLCRNHPHDCIYWLTFLDSNYYHGLSWKLAPHQTRCRELILTSHNQATDMCTLTFPSEKMSCTDHIALCWKRFNRLGDKNNHTPSLRCVYIKGWKSWKKIVHVPPKAAPAVWTCILPTAPSRTWNQNHRTPQ